MPLQTAILADDLTGAADTAAAFLPSPLPVSVRWANGGDDVMRDADGVVAVDAATRRMSEAEAAARMRELAAACRARHASLIYKKIDSRLRGHVAAEVAAVAAGEPHCLAIVAPAFPAVGRTTIDGRVLIDGRLSPDIPALGLIFASAAAVGHVDRGGVRGGDLAMRLATASAGIMLCDAETDDDLSRIARAGIAAGRPVLWVGSGGLARALARSASATAAATARVSPASPACRAREQDQVRGPILTVVGSASAVARAQVRGVAAEGAVDVRVAPSALDGAAWLTRVDSALDRFHDVVVSLDSPEALMGDGDVALVVRLATRLAASIRRAVGGLVLTGGDTASAVLRALGCAGLALVDEPEPGVVLSTTIGQAWPVITKAGSFGTDSTLAAAVRYLRGLRD